MKAPLAALALSIAVDSGQAGREQRLEALAREHESICRSEPRLTALPILELHPPVKGEREEGHLHETQSMSVWIFRLSGQEGQCISRTKTRARHPLFFSTQKTNVTKRKRNAARARTFITTQKCHAV